MEYWDLYDKNRNKLNKTVKRGEKLSDDEFHLVVNAWIRNSKNQFLITQRSANKSYAFKWECTGGSAIKGESSVEAAIREIKEELGIDVFKENGKLIGSTLRYYEGCPDILDVWVFESDVDIKNVTIQEEEVNDVMWATSEEIYSLYNQDKFEANAFFGEVLNIKNDKVYYIGLNAHNAICNDNFFSGSLTLYPTNEKNNIFYSKKYIKDTNSEQFRKNYQNFIYKNLENIQNIDKKSQFIFFNKFIGDLCSEFKNIGFTKNNNSNLIDKLNNKFFARNLAKKYIDVLDYRYINNETSYEELLKKWPNNGLVVQSNRGSGGIGTYFVKEKDNMPKLDKNLEYCVSSYVKHLPLNITLVIYDDGILILPISAQLILKRNNQFMYYGGDFVYPQKLDNNVKSQITSCSLNICNDLKNMGYRGIIGLDYILTNKKLIFMEINPRFQSSSFLISLSLREKYNIDIAELHYNALQHKKMPLNISLESINYSYVNCNSNESFSSIDNYKEIKNGYFCQNPDSYYRKVFERSIINEYDFENE